MKKKKVITLLLTAAMVLSTAGCSNLFGKSGQNVEDNSADDNIVDVSSDKKSAENSNAFESADGDVEPSYNKKFETDNNIVLNYDDTILYIVDQQGNLVVEYDLEAVKDIFAKQDIQPGSEDLKRYADGILYYSVDTITDTGSYATVYAVDPVNGEVREIYRTGDDEYASFMDVSDGKLFFQESGQKNSSNTGHSYSISEGFSFEESADLEYDDYFNATSSYVVTQDYTRIGDKHYAAYILSDLGFIIGKKDDALYKLDKSGNPELIFKAEAGSSPMAYFYDANNVIYYLRDQDYNWVGVYVLDMESGESKLITDDSHISLVAYENGILYYIAYDYSELGCIKQRLYAHDTSDGTTKVILDERTVPGTITAEPISFNIQVSGNNLFVPRFEEGKYVWSVADVAAEQIEFKSLGLVAKSYPLFDYGTVEAITASYPCPDCGQNLAEYYGEKFILDSKFSEHAAEINQEISDYIEGSANVTVNDSEFFNSSCEDHQAAPDMYIVQDSDNVSDASIIDDRYLTVELSGYWYGGGAHGMPSVAQFIFDLTTGQKLSVKDFYKGTDEELKTLVATKVKEDYIKNNDGYKYFAASEDEAYEQAYESANPDDRLLFRQDGADFSFYPYDLGPYASGFITVHLTYEELLGRSTLSE